MLEVFRNFAMLKQNFTLQSMRQKIYTAEATSDHWKTRFLRYMKDYGSKCFHNSDESPDIKFWMDLFR